MSKSEGIDYVEWCLHPADDLLMIIMMMGEVHHVLYPDPGKDHATINVMQKMTYIS